jgi:CDP-glucose 4,6-dehydratase
MFKDLLTQQRKAFWKDRSVFVTGGFGLLGSTVVEMLDALGARVTLLKRDHVPSSRVLGLPAMQRANVVHGDFEDYNTVYRALNEYEVDTVFHLGAQPIAPVGNRAPLPTLRANIMGTANVMEAARLSPLVKRVLVASSDKAYGAQPVLPYTEEASLNGKHPYDVSKSCTDLIAQMYWNTYKVPVCVTRCGNLYGPGDLNWQRVVPDTINHAFHGEQPVIRSDGKMIRDYFFIRDAANAYLTLAENMDRPEIVGQAFNFSTGNSMTVLEIVAHVLNAMGRSDLEPIILNKPEAKAEIHDQTLSSEKARKLLNWTTHWTIEEGLAETVAWYIDHLEKKQRFLDTGSDALLS